MLRRINLLPQVLLLTILAVLSTGATPQANVPLQGFVSSRLLEQWCASDDPLDNEACLSYLRGAFDVLQLARHQTHRSLLETEDGADTICISRLSPINQLKQAALRYSARHPDRPQTQSAAVFVMRMFRDTYPCI